MRRFVVAVIVFLLLAGLGHAQTRSEKTRSIKKTRAAESSGVQTYNSPHFLMYSDLAPDEARDLLKQMETMLRLITAYWGRPCSGILECYVAKNIREWPEEITSQMPPAGLAKIRSGEGVMLGVTMTNGKRMAAKAKVFAFAKEGIPLHEAVHGYCQQTFGHTGPQWYAEGMAELGHYWLNERKGVNAPPVVIKYLRETAPRTITEVVVEEEDIGGTWQDYAWWWFLCHLLENNPNYTADFRAMGMDILNGRKTSFEQVFGSRRKELTLEYDFFLEHFDAGYRVDLCSIDWKRKFLGATLNRSFSATVQAGRGWQPSSLIVVEKTTYEYAAAGTWRPGKKAEMVDANGAADGTGRLVGAIMKDYAFGKEFELGRSGEFTAESSGNLFLRCRAPWNKLVDNSGKITVKLKQKAAESSSDEKK